MKIPDEPKNLNYRKIVASIPFLMGITTVITSRYAPEYFLPFFSSNDSFRWLSPFILFMGIIFSLYSLVLIIRNKKYRISEHTIAGAFIVLFAGMMIFVSLQRFTSGIRFLETYNEIMAMRLATGHSIYPPPEMDPIGTVYTPLYFIITGVLYALFPEGYAYGRLVSLMATLVTAIFVYKNSVLYYNNKKAGLWAVVLFLSTYSFVNKSYDKCFVDSLLMCLLTVALYFYLHNTSKGDFFAILFCSLACFTKQTALFPLILMVVFSLLSKRSVLIYTPLFVSMLLAGILMYITKGQAWFYLFVYPVGHGVQKNFPTKILYNLFILQIFTWIGLFFSHLTYKPTRFHYYLVTALFTALFGVFKGGGGFQAVLVLEPAICIAACLLVSSKKYLLIPQILISLYNPFSTLYPYATIRNPDKQIKEILIRTKGEVWLPMETYLYHGTHKREWDNFCALFGPTWSGFAVPDRLLNALKTNQFECIIIRKNSTGLYSLFHPDIKKYIKKNYWKNTTEELVIFRSKKGMCAP